MGYIHKADKIADSYSISHRTCKWTNNIFCEISSSQSCKYGLPGLFLQGYEEVHTGIVPLKAVSVTEKEIPTF
jgi:hypothetical protein